MTKFCIIFAIFFTLWFCVIPHIFADKVKIVNLNLWSLYNANKTIVKNNLKTPISVYSALEDKYGNVLDSQNDESLRWIAYDNWTFYTDFKITLDKLQSVNLTFNGIDTVATIRLNHHEIGKTDNMFVRYSFEVTQILKDQNLLEIEIQSPVLIAKARADALKAKGINTPPDCPHIRTNGECHRNMIRKMQMSFGADWSLSAPSMGIWKSVDLEYYEVAIMRDVDVAIRRNDTHWTLDIRVFLSTGTREKFYADLMFIAAELVDNPILLEKKKISYKSPQINFEVNIPKGRVELWWPNGYGNQKLYPLFFAVQCWRDKNGPRMGFRTKSQKTINVGFRTIELEEDNDDFGRSFFFKINDKPIFIKGASYVPSHIWPELSYQESRLEHIIKSAKASHFNMIRVWGGGLYEADIFYNLTDRHGLLVWQEMAFTGATYPMNDEFVDSVRLEISQNAQRLGYHPSLCILVTNDEIELYLTKNKTEFGSDSQRLEDEYKQLFMGTIRHELNIISRNDFNPRAGPLISTPSMGVEESKKDLSIDPQNPNYGDVHFWEDEKDGFDPTIYPRARFITEYGFQSLPILSSWNRTMYPKDDLATIVKHRQHDPKAFIPMLQMTSRHFGLPLMDWEDDIEIYIYLSQVSQAIATKTATDFFRSQRTHKRTMGAMYWQLNDAWVAPTWSSIDYFGNYKLLWYWSKSFMAPTSIIALMDLKTQRINITVTKEEHVDEIKKPQKYNITIYTYLWSELYYRKSITYEIEVASNGLYFESSDMETIFNSIFSRNNCFLKFELSQKGKVIAKTFLFPGKFHHAIGMSDPDIKMALSSNLFYERNPYTYYSITITVQKPAIFVYIEIHHPDVDKYILSENGFVLIDPVKILHLELEAKSDTCLTLSEEHIRVFTLNHILVGGKTTFTKTDLKSCPTSAEIQGGGILEVVTSKPIEVTPNDTKR